MTSPKLSCLAVVGFLIAGCPEDPPSTPSCPEGSAQCPCYANNTCDQGLACTDGFCITEGGNVCAGAAGSETCPCYPNGTCDGALECVDSVCVEPTAPQLGAEGDPCGGELPNCEATLECRDNVCSTPSTTCGEDTWGPDCTPCACVNGTCADGPDGDGSCACDDGWAGDACDSCDAGYFGAECEACACGDHGTCDDGLTGDGACTCDEGWTGQTCYACDVNYYGPDCTACTCTGVNAKCDDGLTGDGSCGCLPGWTGADCDECEGDTWGPDCTPCACGDQGTCASGVAGDGTCTCNDGWAGDACDACAAGYFGADCQACTCTAGTCNDGLDGDGTCTCPTGFTGDACDTCATGFVGADCDVCDTGFWGADCSPCSCVNGSCDEGLTGTGACTCDPGFAGDACDTCTTGFEGAACDTCSAGTFGADCQPCSCVNGVCDEGLTGSGECSSCVTGWTGANCDTCSENYYGQFCQPCPCLNGTCDDGLTGDGSCQCAPGWTGDGCDTCAQGYGGATCTACAADYQDDDGDGVCEHVCVTSGCDDLNSCTSDVCDPTEGCTFPVVANGTSCTDGDPCTEGDTCQDGACEGPAKDCDDNSVCTTEVCDSTVIGGCVYTEIDCDDGQPCTANDCDAATGCVNSSLNTGASCDDGDRCTTGTTCTIGLCIGGTAVVCDDGNACTDDSCDSTLGCVATAVPDGTSCDDGNGCTISACQSQNITSALTCGELGWTNAAAGNDPSVCGSGDCEDSVRFEEAEAFCSNLGARLCTLDELRASEHGGGNNCGTNNNDVWSSSPCAPNGESYWVFQKSGNEITCRGTIEPTRVRCCADSALAQGISKCLPTEANCGAGDFSCTQVFCDHATEVCSAGPVETEASCDDGKACTEETCSNFGGCYADRDASINCDDGDPCTVDICYATGGGGCGVSGSLCSNPNPCVAVQCFDNGDGTGSCQYTPDDSACDDGLPCTTDICDVELGCVSTLSDCDDGVACTTDTCESSGQCTNTPDDSACDDGDPCTADSCSAGGCLNVAQPGVACDGALCTVGTCGAPTVSASSCLDLGFDPEAGGDPSVCTFHVGELSGGVCRGDHDTAEAQCAAVGARLCTLDEAAAERLVLGTPCDATSYYWVDSPCDSNSSWAADHSSLFVANYDALCEPNGEEGLAIACCADAEPAEKATETVCIDEAASCGDTGCRQVECRFDSTLDGSHCVRNSSTACDDGDACTTDTCDPFTECVYTVDDPGTCAVCTTNADCDDGLECTHDVCDPDNGCVHALDDALCDDGDPCTLDICFFDGSCVNAPSGLNNSCDSGTPCASGLCQYKINSANACSVFGWDTTAGADDTVCASGLVAGGGACSGLVDQGVAEAACTAAGARLCTAAEILADEAANTGCSDDIRVWTSTPCGPNGVWTMAGSSAHSANHDMRCVQRSDAIAEARCCADTGAVTGLVCVDQVSACDDGLGCTSETCELTYGQCSGSTTTQCDSPECCLEADADELCADGVYADGRCYVAYGSIADLTWVEALAKCVEEGGTLATVLSESGNATARQQATDVCGLLPAYIGMSGLIGGGDQAWVSGSQVVYTKWRQDEPAGGTADYGLLRTNAFWESVDGTAAEHCLVCEFQPLGDSGVCFASQSCLAGQ